MNFNDAIQCLLEEALLEHLSLTDDVSHRLSQIVLLFCQEAVKPYKSMVSLVFNSSPICETNHKNIEYFYLRVFYIVKLC